MTVYRFSEHYLMVVNASNRTRILSWIEQHRGPFDAEVEDRTSSWAMLALQGPNAQEILSPLVDAKLAEIGYYRASETGIGDERAVVARMGVHGRRWLRNDATGGTGTPILAPLTGRGEVPGTPAGRAGRARHVAA